MGVRFRRRLRLIPGVHVNISGSGASLSVGPRGASATLSRQGVHSNVGIPGTGLYLRERLSGTSGSRTLAGQDAGTSTAKMGITISLQDDGVVRFEDEGGSPLPENLVRLAKKQHGESMRVWMREQAEEINRPIEDSLNIHLNTPAPGSVNLVERKRFRTPAPNEPKLSKIGWFTRWFLRKRKRRLEAENEKKLSAYRSAVQAWEKLKESFEENEEKRVSDLKERIRTDVELMERMLSIHLGGINWPHETDVSFEINDNAHQVLLDVDLPEIEDMPVKQANVPQRGWKVSIKTVSERQQRINYMKHVHAVAFRLAGEVYGFLPHLQSLKISGYSQRPDPTSGHIRDEYLFSVKIPRTKWEAINFRNLSKVNPVEAIESFELERKMTKTGIFKPIDPIAF